MSAFTQICFETVSLGAFVPPPAPKAIQKQQPSIRNRLYIAGRFFQRDPVPIVITPNRFEVITRLSNSGLRVDRLYKGAGFPNIPNRHTISTPWPDLREGDLLEHLDLIAAIGQPVTVGVWKQVTDVFDGDGVTATFLLQRRQLLPSVTPAVSPQDYPTRVFMLDRPYGDPLAVQTELLVVHKTAATISIGNPNPGEAWVEDDGHQIGNLWASTLRLYSAPQPMHDALVAIYLPLYLMVIRQETPRSYAAALQEPRGLVMDEFG